MGAYYKCSPLLPCWSRCSPFLAGCPPSRPLRCCLPCLSCAPCFLACLCNALSLYCPYYCNAIAFAMPCLCDAAFHAFHVPHVHPSLSLKYPLHFFHFYVLPSLPFRWFLHHMQMPISYAHFPFCGISYAHFPSFQVPTPSFFSLSTYTYIYIRNIRLCPFYLYPHLYLYTHLYIYIYIYIYVYIYIYIYVASQVWVHSYNHGLPHGWSRSFFDRLIDLGHELMHPEAYLERLASTKQNSDAKKLICNPFSSILLIFVSVSAYFV